jgi:BMFP domain-containing protein YqiC
METGMGRIDGPLFLESAICDCHVTFVQHGREHLMTQTSNRLFDGLGRLMTDAAGMADNVKREIDTVVKNQAERILGDMDLVKREEFEAARELAANARAESERLATRVAALESQIAAFTAGSGADAPKTRGRKPADS